MAEALPGKDAGDRVPVVLPVAGTEETITPADTAGTIDDAGVVPVVLLIAGMEAISTGAVPGTICPVGMTQVTTVPGVVGSDASGTGASVVSGVPGWVVAENGPGPLSGDVTIAAGVVGRPMAVVPMTETCARQAWQPANRAAVVNSKRRVAISSSAPI